MPSAPSIHTLPIFRNTYVSEDTGPDRIPVDHRVNGQRIKYWRALRATGPIKWEVFPHFPLVLNADGSPWPEACMWLLDRARTNPHKISSLNPIAQGLRAYREFLDSYGLSWSDFSSEDKYLRPTYIYKTHLQGLVNAGVIRDTTARGRMLTVVGLYRFLMGSERMSFSPLYAPWIDRTVGIQYRDKQGFKQIKEVTTVDVSVKVSNRVYAWDRRIQDGGQLMPLSRLEQKELVGALKKLGNVEYELMHHVTLLSGARIQTVLTLRLGPFLKTTREINQWPFKLQCGPGTGIDTKGNRTNVHLAIQRELYESLHTYAHSERARSRRDKSILKQDPMNYLFLSNRGGPYYESKDERNALRDAAEPLKRSSSTGQNLRSFIANYVIPEIQKSIPGFHYQFHDLRATFGLNWVDAVMSGEGGRQRYLWAREQLRKLMWHKSATTTDRYIEYRQTAENLDAAEASWGQDLVRLIKSA